MTGRPEILIIGGSLSGLTLALACANRGVSTRVLERSANFDQHGSALGVDRSLLLRVIGHGAGNSTKFPTVTQDRQALSWKALHAWLHAEASQRPEIIFVGGCGIRQVEQSAYGVVAITDKGDRIAASIAVGADGGYGSLVRKLVSPDHPLARYAGYLLWRGLVFEKDLPPEKWAPKSNQGIALANTGGYRLVAYPIAGATDSLEPGRRWISFAWYDHSHNRLLQDAHRITADGYVLASLHGQNVPDQIRDRLGSLARRLWPEPWSSMIIHVVERRQVFATPAAEYFPERLCRGRMTLIGDAAHVVSPTTGEGFTAGILDAEALADCLADHLSTDNDLAAALRTYEEKRLVAAQALVRRSQVWSRAFLENGRRS